ncbi:unnamed protein product [Rodentolepis nana]|uniref:Uncharacterized protein n=1 Tax=Rodentolepis nana TaxID=102285 RepID=A0A3P7SQV7_RODNA|nr:unnamed protein product [Rodentolepis nana]
MNFPHPSAKAHPISLRFAAVETRAFEPSILLVEISSKPLFPLWTFRQQNRLAPHQPPPLIISLLYFSLLRDADSLNPQTTTTISIKATAIINARTIIMVRDSDARLLQIKPHRRLIWMRLRLSRDFRDMLTSAITISAIDALAQFNHPISLDLALVAVAVEFSTVYAVF